MRIMTKRPRTFPALLAMRIAICVLPTAMLVVSTQWGCSSTSAGNVTPSPSYTSKDFGSFRWNWYGTGISEQFAMDRDCGVTATAISSGLGASSGNGVVAIDDCTKFQSLVVSKEVIGALNNGSTQCTKNTDDFGSFRVDLADGKAFGSSTTGCSTTAPFSTVQSEIHRLEKLYAPLTPDKDAATDTPGD
jgi:hypothetical protein